MAARSAVRTLVTVANGPLETLHQGLDDVQVAIAGVHDEVRGTYFRRRPKRSRPSTCGATAPAPARRPGTSSAAPRE